MKIESTNKKYASLGARFLAIFIDSLILGVLSFFIAKLTGFSFKGYHSIFLTIDFEARLSTMLSHLNNFSTVYYLLSLFFYFILLEWKFGATIGKFFAKIKVLKQSGEPLDFKSAILRNLMRSFDFLPFGYIVGAIAIWKSPTKQRLGDQVAGTVVVAKYGS